MDKGECCGVTADTCDERRDSCKEARIAREDVLMEAMKARDKRLEKLESRFDQILLAILVQLTAFFFMYVGTKM